MAVASLVLGIASNLLGLLPFIALLLAILGLALGVISRNSPKKGLAVAGIVLSALAVAWGLFYNGAIIKNGGHFKWGTSATTTTQTTP